MQTLSAPGLVSAFRRHPFGLSFLAVASFCAFSMAFLDRPLALALKANVSPHVEGFFKILTELGESQIYLVPAALLWLLFRLRARKALAARRERLLRHAWICLFMIASILSSGIVVNAIKFAAGRYRPRYLFDQGLYGFSPFSTEWAMNSFPSGHSQGIWAAMMALTFILPRYDAAWLVLAVLVSASRMITTVHYLSDVTFGSYLAIVMTILVKKWFDLRGIDVQVRMERDKKLM